MTETCPDAVATAAAIRDRRTTAESAVAAALDRIGVRDGAINAFTSLRRDAALEEARALDRRNPEAANAGPLMGVPFAVKNLFDVAGVVTLAGSKLYAGNPPAERDAAAVARLRSAGAVLAGALNMDEFAYGFTTENSHYGPTRNPRDAARIAGGSSGGSAASVAAGMVPVSLGTDTNGSVRVPAALCGVLGFKPTFGRISRAGTVPLASSFDHVGLFARTVRDIAAVYDALQGADAEDPACTDRPAAPCRGALDDGIEGFRIAVADGHFATGGSPQAFAAVAAAAHALGAARRVSVPEAERALNASLLITSCEAAAYHLDALRQNPDQLDASVRNRLTAAALVPASWHQTARRFRRRFRTGVSALFQEVDLVLAPTTPFAAPFIGQHAVEIDGQEVSVRATLGRFTAPVSFIGLPALSVPVGGVADLPLGVQLIAAPWREEVILRAARVLEAKGVCAAPVAV